MSYNMQPKNNEDEEVVKARERKRLVEWMRGVIAEKPDIASQKAFMAKVHGTASYHGITLEELLQGLPDKSGDK